MSDEYKTIESPSTASLKVSGSRFLASAHPVSSKEEVDAVYARISREFHDATHNCFACRLGTSADRYRFNDDGEPSGTAGRPILAVIDRRELTDVLVVVTRYFGGTKLGTGGLMRAYGDVADLALGDAVVVKKFVTERIRVTFPHDQTGNVMRMISREEVEILDTFYDDEVHLNLGVRRSVRRALERDLMNATAGNIRFGDS